MRAVEFDPALVAFSCTDDFGTKFSPDITELDDRMSTLEG